MQNFLSYRVKDFMVSRPRTLTVDSTLAQAQDLFETYGFNAIPIVDPNGRLDGLLSQFDVLKAFRISDPVRCPSYEEIATQPVAAFMSKDVETLDPEERVARALDRMIELKRNSLPVAEGGNLIGMLSRQDVVYALRLAAGIEDPRHPD